MNFIQKKIQSLEKHAPFASGLLFVALFASSATYIASSTVMQFLGLSPLIIGIVMGMLYSLLLHNHINPTWVPGIVFSVKKILRIAIILYGFRVTFQDIFHVGMEGLIMSITMVVLTMTIGIIIGKILKLDTVQTLLISIGSAVCGAAAVLALESVLNSKPYKSSLAVSTVIIFGTLSMFLYPYFMHIFHITQNVYALYAGGSIHEVAQVVGASSFNTEIMNEAVIVKMIRVLMLIPTLILMGVIFQKHTLQSQESTSFFSKITASIPWFAILFVAVIGFHSFHLLPNALVEVIKKIDTFLLTMTMTAIGMETPFKKIIGTGIKPIVLGLILFLWLIVGGYFLAYTIHYFL